MNGKLGGFKMNLLLTATGTSQIQSYILIAAMAAVFALMYFTSIRPQKQEQKRKTKMLSELALNDTVLTTSGFYGVVIDITDDTVIVEFGNNKNCRIPMQKAAIVEVEKLDSESK